jgi:Spy/CpxP family protein refolding chaperone
MIAELMVANAAFKVIKETISHGGELAAAGKAVSDWMGASRDISKLPASKSATFGSAFEGFQAQELIRTQRAELEEMIKKTRIHAWRDFQEYEREYYREIRNAEKAEARRKAAQDKEIKEALALASKVVGTILLITAALFGVALYLR